MWPVAADKVFPLQNPSARIRKVTFLFCITVKAAAAVEGELIGGCVNVVYNGEGIPVKKLNQILRGLKCLIFFGVNV